MAKKQFIYRLKYLKKTVRGNKFMKNDSLSQLTLPTNCISGFFLHPVYIVILSVVECSVIKYS